MSHLRFLHTARTHCRRCLQSLPHHRRLHPLGCPHHSVPRHRRCPRRHHCHRRLVACASGERWPAPVVGSVSATRTHASPLLAARAALQTLSFPWLHVHSMWSCSGLSSTALHFLFLWPLMHTQAHPQQAARWLGHAERRGPGRRSPPTPHRSESEAAVLISASNCPLFVFDAILKSLQSLRFTIVSTMRTI